MELIKVQKREINGENINSVDARELHEFLESRQEYTSWIKNRISKYDFAQGIDFTSFDNSIKRETGSTTRTEYIVSIDMAKELSMVEKNEKGKQARKYFIECEKIAKG
ncbi:MAG: phage antirepressor Ant, partial [Deltaproteobacteria bacterium]|nr:phage antirepressor Ant [Deltaproteobacteria bacterium]